jgi:hypothetical protein
MKNISGRPGRSVLMRPGLYFSRPAAVVPETTDDNEAPDGWYLGQRPDLSSMTIGRKI